MQEPQPHAILAGGGEPEFEEGQEEEEEEDDYNTAREQEPLETNRDGEQIVGGGTFQEDDMQDAPPKQEFRLSEDGSSTVERPRP